MKKHKSASSPHSNQQFITFQDLLSSLVKEQTADFIANRLSTTLYGTLYCQLWYPLVTAMKE